MRTEELHSLIRQALAELEPAITAGGTSIESAARSLLLDLESNFSTVVILGEFNRGKSTLLNALIGEDLLPVGVLPTTASINVLRYNREPILRVHMSGSNKPEERPLTAAVLKEYAAGTTETTEPIAYLEIGLPSPMLGNGIVYVDTPGVGDLNRLRAEITYRFLPRADLVLFLLDAANPVRKTEAEFLRDSVLSSGIERIVFVANFADLVEADDLPIVELAIHNRLAAALGAGDRIVVLVSARQAMEGRRSSNAQALNESGLPGLARTLDHLLEADTMGAAKARQYVRRACAIAEALSSELQVQIELQKVSDSEIEQRMTALAVVERNRTAQCTRIGTWTEDREREILAIIGKSLNLLGDRLETEVRDLILEYSGPHFQQFVETRVSNTVRRLAKSWIEGYAPVIGRLLSELAREMAAAFGRSFQIQLDTAPVECGAVADAQSLTSFGVSADDVSGSFTKAGLITGVGAGVLIAVGAPILTPILAMAGLPMLQRVFLEHNLSDAKSKAVPEITAKLRQSFEEFSGNVLNAVRSQVRSTCTAAEKSYEAHVAFAREQTEHERTNRRNERAQVGSRIGELSETRSGVLRIRASLLSLLETIRDPQEATK